jgi:hypothetical protein
MAMQTPNPTAPPDPLVRPLFFAGQALTDRDLTDLVGWVDRRFALRRQTAGWGVVCGLDVTPDPNNSAGLIVTPGYAVDCPGRDLLLTDPAPLDFSPAKNGTTRCPQPGARGNSSSGSRRIGPVTVNLDRLTVYDILFQPAPVSASNESPALRRSSCGTPGCDWTRRRDEGVPVPVQRKLADACAGNTTPTATPVADPGIDLLKRFQNAFAAAFTINLQIAAGQSTPLPPVAGTGVQNWLLGEIGRNPALLAHFPTLQGWLKRNGAAALTTPWDVARVLFWFADAARRLPVVACADCADCSDCPVDGVPLARVWVGPDDTGKTAVLSVDKVPPHRRPFGPDAAAPDPLDPRYYLGQPSGLVQHELTRLGVATDVEPFEIPADGKHLHDLLAQEKRLAPGARAVEVGTQAVVSFREGLAEPNPVTKPGAGLQIRLFPVTDQAPQESPPAVGTVTGDELKANFIPAGGFVKVALDWETVQFDTTDKARTFTVYVHDPLGDRLFAVGNMASPSTIVATLRVPDTADRDDVTMTALVEDKTTTAPQGTTPRPDRLVAVQGQFGKPVKPAPLSGSSSPDLRVALTQQPTGSQCQREVIVLRGGKLSPVEVKFSLSNPSPGEITGDLSRVTVKGSQAGQPDSIGKVHQQALARPGDPIIGDGIIGDGKFLGPAQTFQNLDETADKLVFALSGKDVFGREFTVPDERRPSLPFTNVQITVAVENRTTGNSKGVFVTLDNNTRQAVQVSALTATPLPPAQGSMITVTLGNNTQLGTTDHDKKKDYVLNGADSKVIDWRVSVEFDGGAVSGKVVGSRDVTATTV